MVCIKAYGEDHSSRYGYHCVSELAFIYETAVQDYINFSLHAGFGWYLGKTKSLIFFSTPLIYQGW